LAAGATYHERIGLQVFSMKNWIPTSRCLAGAALLAGFLLLVAGPTGGQEFWRGKSAGEWTREEALAILTDSPWAREVVVSYYSGRLMEEVREGERNYISGRGKPTIPVPTRETAREPERVQARYRVWWSSAAVVQEARKRLLQLAPPAVVDIEAPPPLAPPDHHVLTVRVLQPPAPPESPLFQGLSGDELQARAELRTSKKLTLKPERAERRGVGAGASVSFFFPRRQAGQPTVPAETGEVKFEFKGEGGHSLTVKFNARELQ